MTAHREIYAWPTFGPDSVTGTWSANQAPVEAEAYVRKSDMEALAARLAEVEADLTFMTDNRNKWQDACTIARNSALEEAARVAGAAAVEVLLRQEPDASLLKQQLTRQMVAKRARAMREKPV